MPWNIFQSNNPNYKENNTNLCSNYKEENKRQFLLQVSRFSKLMHLNAMQGAQHIWLWSSALKEFLDHNFCYLPLVWHGTTGPIDWFHNLRHANLKFLIKTIFFIGHALGVDTKESLSHQLSRGLRWLWPKFWHKDLTIALVNCSRKPT